MTVERSLVGTCEGCEAVFTLRPSAYPGRSDAAHIHPIIFEPSGRYYWIDEYLFEDDPLLGKDERMT